MLASPRLAVVFACLSAASISLAQVPGSSNAFVENKGQWDSRANFLAREPGLNLWLTNEGPVMDFYKFTRTNKVDPNPKFDRAEGILNGHVIHMSFVGANQMAENGVGAQKGVFNYILGKTSIKAVKRYGEAHVDNLYQGISARYYFDKGAPRYDLIVHEGADPSQIAMRMEGANRLSVLANGNLEIETSLGPIEESGLTVYQLNGATKKIIPAAMAVDGETVRFQVGAYDKTKDLVIDPVLFSSYIGGSGGGAGGDKVLAVSGVGYNNSIHDEFAAGTAESPDFPVVSGSYQTTKQQGGQGFVADIYADGTLIWCTFIQGTSQNSSALVEVTCATVDSTSDQVFIGGAVENEIFPTTVGALQTSNKNTAAYQGFISELSQDGSTLQNSTYLSGTTSDTSILGIARNAGGDLAVTGRTKATDFPMMYPVEDTNTSADGGLAGCAFAAVLSSDFKTQKFGTYITGGGSEIGYAIAITSNDELYVAGTTTSGEFPVTEGCYQDSNNASSGTTGFFILLGNDGGTDGLILDASYFGGTGYDTITAMYVNADGSATLAGTTTSTDIAVGDYQSGLNGPQNGFICNFSGDATHVNAFTYFGGSGYDNIYGICGDGARGLYVVGATTSIDFPNTPGCYQTILGAGSAGFLGHLTEDLHSLLFGSYYGFNTSVNSVCVDGSGNAYIGGSAGYVPTTPSAFQSQNAATGTASNGFVADISPLTEYVNIYGPEGYTIVGGSTVTGNVVMSSVANQGGTTIGMDSNSSLVNVPNTITIPPNSVIGTFNIVCKNVSSATPASIDAVYGNDSTYRFKIMPHGIKSVTFSPASILGGASATGTVTLSGPAGSTPMTVTLHTSTPSALYVPPTMTIAAGATSGTFTTSTAAVATSTKVTITATNDSGSMAGIETVTPPGPSKLAFTTASLIGGKSTIGTVTLNAKAGAAGVTVTLTSSNTAAVQVPTSVKVLAGATSATFTLTTSQVQSQSTSLVSAISSGTTASATVTVQLDQLASLSIAPNAVVGGAHTFATLDLISPIAPYAVNASLTSSNTAVAQPVATQLTISAVGAASQMVTIYTFPVNAPTAVTLTATSNGSTKVQTLTVNPPALLKVTTTPTTVKGGASVSCTVAIDGFSASLGSVIMLKSSSAKLVVPASVKVLPGKSIVTFTLATSVVTGTTPVTITATQGATVKTCTLTITL